MEGTRRGNKLEVNEPREGANGIEEAKKEEARKEDRTREARQGNSNKEEAGTEEAGTERTDKEQKEFPRVVSIDEEQPEQLLLEVKESKRKKTKKKTANKVKDEIKLALVSVYALMGATLDECFYLKPNEADLLAEAIYRYLDEHNLIHTISQKSATFNLIVALVSVNLPKFTEYYKLLKNKKEGQQNNEQEREAKLDSGQGANGNRARRPDNSNAKTHLDQFYIANE